MKNYDLMSPGINIPFAMLSGPQNYKSNHINTDKFGFRFTLYKDELISLDDIEKFDEINILVGGSTVFGVGATDDSTTISSYLSKKTGEVWLNLGIRGGVSLTEYIHLIRFIYKAKKVKSIVFFSGINDIYINQLKDIRSEIDNLFNDNIVSAYSCKRLMLTSIFSKLYNVSINELINKPLNEIIFYPKYKSQYILPVELNEKEKFEITIENFSRNFFLYAGLQKQLSCKVVYILQPFTDWTNKTFTYEEKVVFQELQEIQKKSKWATHREKLSLNLYNNIVDSLKKLAYENKIDFIDSHSYFTSNKSLFVDAVHLNDNGNEISSELIYKYVYKVN